MYICNKCKNIHQRVQTTIEHAIIEVQISGGLIHVQPTGICTDNIPCLIHKSKLSCMFCRSCDMLVCSNCISISHKRHDLESIDEVCIDKLKKLILIRCEIFQNLLRSESENKDLEKDDCMWDSISVDAIKKIDQREKKMIRQIRKYGQELKDNIEEKNRKNKQMISQRAKEIDKTKNTLEVQQDKIRSAMISKKAGIIIAAAAEYGDHIPKFSFTKLRPEIQEFVSGEHDISKLFGILTTVKSSNKSHPT